MLLNDLKSVLIVLWTFIMPIEVWATILPTKSVEIRMNADITANSQKLVLGDVATIFSKSLPYFEQLSSLVIGQFSEGQSELSIPSSYIEARIREVTQNKIDFVLHAPPKVTFQLESIGTSSTDLAEVAIQKGRKEGRWPDWIEPRVEWAQSTDKFVSEKKDRISIEGPAGQYWRGDLSFKISSLDKSEKTEWIKAKVRWYAKVWTTVKPIAAGSTVSSSDLKSERIEITNLSAEPIFSHQDLNTILRQSKTKRSIAEGSPISTAYLNRMPDLRPGQNLKVVFVSESGIRVVTDGALVGVGLIGEEGKAKLRASRKIVTGKLMPDATLEVSL